MLILAFLFKKQKALAEANDAKVKGNRVFGDGQYEEALSEYGLALQVAPDVPTSVEIRSICHANRALCYLKLVCSYLVWYCVSLILDYQVFHSVLTALIIGY